LLPDSLIPISIPANAPAAAYSGSIITSNASGCTSVAAVFTVSVNAHPDASQVILSTTIACSGDSPIISVVSASLGDGAFTVQYDLSGANSSTGNTATLSMLSGNGTFVVAAPSNTGSTLLTITSISNSSNCSSSTTGDTVTIVVRRAGTWLGPVSTDWFTDANWCGGVPVAATNVLIRGGSPFYPAVNGGTAVATNVAVLSGASLTVNGGILQIAGTIANSGIFDVSNGSIAMNGSSAQIIPAAIFAGNAIKNLTLLNAAGVSLNGVLNLSGILKASSGSFNAGGFLTLLSTAAGTALIDGSGAGEVLGNVTMQRYLASGFGYKYFSSPFQADSVNDFSQEINLAAPFPDVYSFDESLSSAGWINYTNPSGIFTPMAGYAVNFGSSSAPLTVSLTGVVNNHTVSSPDLYNHNMPFTQGFNLVGNPYPSPINWDITAGWTKTNIDNALYFFNAGTTDQYTGTYSSYVSGVSSDGIAGNVISAMQGFFIHVSNGTFPVTGQLAVNNNARNLNPNTVFLGFTAPRGPSPLLRLTAGFADEVTISDPAVFYFQEGGTRTFNNKLDALKLMNTHIGVPNLYAVAADSAKLSIFALPDFPDSLLVIPLGLKTAKDGWITFRAADLSNIPAGLYVYFFDAKTGTDQNLEKTPAYRLFLSSGSYENRFFLKFRTQELITDNGPGSGTFSAYGAAGSIFVDGHLGAGEKGSIAVIDLLGQVMYRQEISGDGYQALHSNFMTGVYLVYFSTAKVSQVKKIFISNR
jgi:fibronectin-binding autotransporter adhesin